MKQYEKAKNCILSLSPILFSLGAPVVRKGVQYGGGGGGEEGFGVGGGVMNSARIKVRRLSPRSIS